MKLNFLLIILLLLPFLGFGATFTVTNTNDSGIGSLRQAIIDANSFFGADNIYFNIPNTDPNYNAVNGIWTISLSSNLPMLTGGYTNIDAITQTTNQGNTNPLGPEIELHGGNTLVYGFRVVSPNNTIKGFIIGQFEFGIQTYGALANGNSIIENYIGTDWTGTMPFSNQYGIGLSGDVANVSIVNNLISGNTIAGIVCSPANNIMIVGNKIGTDISGMHPLPNSIGIILDNSSDNTIGGNSIANRNIISGNTDAGILINDLASFHNTIIGNYIGINQICTDTIPNGNGVMIISAPDNTIGGTTASQRNIISGNNSAGIIINGTGANNNLVIGNFIGIDSSGTVALSNHHGVIIKADANHNIIGGNTTGERNVISANWEIGIYIEASDSNVVSGNLIGTDLMGTSGFSFGIGDSLIQGNGVEINTLSQHNVIGGTTPGERNIISGNRVYGVIFYGNVSQNTVIGNYVGTDVSGSYAIPNATGICVDDASNNNIMKNNLLSGNISYGLFIVTTGSNNNLFIGNLVGTNANGTDTIPNDVGLLIAGGAKYNNIGGTTPADRNIFSGNRYGGIEIVDNGTDQNKIIGNYIGTNITGNVALPNTFGIVASTLTTGSLIDNNVISGNFTFGVVLTDATSNNLVINNLIGVGSDGFTDLGNGASGIVIGQGASNNIVGGIGKGNSIAYNDSSGIVIVDDITINNKISANSIYLNNFLGIDIFPEGVNSNDPGDIDSGPNGLMNFPVINSAGFDSITGTTIIEGTIDTQNPQNTTIEIFRSEPDLLFNLGEGREYLGSTTPDNSGNWTIFVSGVIFNDKITATATNSDGNTSEFSLNATTAVGVEEIDFFDSSVNVYPNPSNGIINVSYFLKNQSYIEIVLYNIDGRKIKTVFNGEKMANEDTLDINMQTLSPGFYFITIMANNQLIGLKKIEIFK